MSSKVQNVVIVGGGLAGPALALCLKKQHGISSTIYELRPEGDERGVNIALAPNGVRVLQHLGVYDDLRILGYSYEELALSTAHSQHLATMLNGSKKLYNYPALRIHRSKVQKALLREVEAQGIPMHFGMKLVGARESSAGVELEFADGQTVTADFAVGADGVHSRVRDCIMDTETEYSGFMGIIGMGWPRDKLHGSSHKFHFPNFCFGKTGFVAMMPSSFDGNEVDFFSTMPYPSQTREQWDALNNNKHELQEILLGRFGKGWPEHISQACRDYNPEKLGLHPFFEVPPLEHWTSSKGRIILIGDAAHAFTPQGGQGASCGLEDAETLAYTLSRETFLLNHLKLLHIWEDHRRDRLAKVKAMTDTNGRLRSPDNAFVQTLKEWIMWAMFKYTGPTLGMQWLFSYNAENILSLL